MYTGTSGVFESTVCGEFVRVLVFCEEISSSFKFVVVKCSTVRSDVTLGFI